MRHFIFILTLFFCSTLVAQKTILIKCGKLLDSKTGLVAEKQNILIKGNQVICMGVEKLHGAPVMARDLRASACLVLAGLAAEGETIIEGLHHMDRGYEYLEEKFMRLGADIQRISE